MRLTRIALCVGACSIVVASAQESEWKKAFDKTYAEARAAEEAERWADAERLYVLVQEFIPREPTTLVSRARCLAHLDRHDEAFACLSRAIESGWNQDALLRDDPAFEQLRERSTFDRLLSRIHEIKQERILVYVPESLDRERPAPLIVAFHGRGENPHLFLPEWTQTADQLGAVVVAPRGVHSVRNGLFNTWNIPNVGKPSSAIDLSACADITERAIEMAARQAPIDVRAIVLAGYSQGGAVALRLLGENPAKYAGAFAQATLYDEQGTAHWRAARQRRAGRVVLLAGELDRLRPHSQRAHADLSAAGWDVRFEVIPKVGHEPPPDNTQRQVDAVNYILRRHGATESASQP